MLSFVKGELSEIIDDTIIVENNNIGFNIRVPMSLIANIPSIGSEVKIYTYLYVREDEISLYGFLTRDDLNIFKLLITVNGIGPKGALAILSTITPNDLRMAIMASDAKFISSAPGIGTKTAQKLIIELKDKISLSSDIDTYENVTANADTSNVTNETIMALVALGYSNTEATRAVKAVDNRDSLNSEELLKQALKKLF